MSSDNKEYETYYVPESSKLPLFASIALFLLVFGAANLMNNMSGMSAPFTGSVATWLPIVGFVLFSAVLFVWFRTTIRENMAGLPSAQLKKSYSLAMMWFIFSEVMFFAAFFGALYYVRNLAGPWLGGEGDRGVTNMLWDGFQYNWPMLTTPQDAVGAAQVEAMNGTFTGAKESMEFPGFSKMMGWLPLWNTIILISSSFTVHVAHHALKENNMGKFKLWLWITVLLAIVFLGLQAEEYIHAYNALGLKLTSGIYGSTFFMLTGFHGFHVTMGAFMLGVQAWRASRHKHFTPDDHFGFEASAWYWHFVDVVWVCLFFFVYIF